MSILEYELKLNELSRFAPKLIPDDDAKCKGFEEGLWNEIQTVVTANTYPSLRVMAQVADLQVQMHRSFGMAKRH